MALKNVAGIELWVMLHGVSVEKAILGKRDGRDGILLASAVIYNAEGLVSVGLRCGEWFTHVNWQGRSD